MIEENREVNVWQVKRWILKIIFSI
jgi:hypothetical protein